MYRIGSFNCLNFGMGSSKDIQKFVDIITSKPMFDIVALQEIKGQNALNRVLSRLPNYWEGIADSEINDYAYIWNTRRVMLANAEEIGKDRIYFPRIYKQYKIDRKSGQTDLIREPFYARFYPCGGAAPYIEIRLINTHIRFSKGKDESSEDENSLGAIAMRRNEFNVLTRAIYAKEADKRYGNNRPAYTIMLGDYNLNHPYSGKTPQLIESFEICDNQSHKTITTIQEELSTLKKPDGSDEVKFSNNYDHFTYDLDRFDSIVVGSERINAVEKFCNGNMEEYKKGVSDHVPVAMNIDFRR